MPTDLHSVEIALQPAPPRMVGYARVSTDDQNLDMQRDALIAAGVAPDFIYEDRVSGAAARRRGLEMAFRALRTGDTLVVWKMDRLGRSLVGLISFVNDVRERGANLKVLTGTQIDTTTAAGKFMFYIFAAMAEFERDLTIERTKSGLAAARLRGRRGGREPVLTPAKKQKALQLMRDKVPGYKIAKAIGISKAVWYENVRAMELMLKDADSGK